MLLVNFDSLYLENYCSPDILMLEFSTQLHLSNMPFKYLPVVVRHVKRESSFSCYLVKAYGIADRIVCAFSGTQRPAHRSV